VPERQIAGSATIAKPGGHYGRYLVRRALHACRKQSLREDAGKMIFPAPQRNFAASPVTSASAKL
jgi:hypothetical protein